MLCIYLYIIYICYVYIYMLSIYIYYVYVYVIMCIYRYIYIYIYICYYVYIYIYMLLCVYIYIRVFSVLLPSSMNQMHSHFGGFPRTPCLWHGTQRCHLQQQAELPWWQQWQSQAQPFVAKT